MGGANEPVRRKIQAWPLNDPVPRKTPDIPQGEPGPIPAEQPEKERVGVPA